LAKRTNAGNELSDLGGPKKLSEDYVAVLVIAIANRLTRGASKYYREAWDLGVVEWRIIIYLGYKAEHAIGEIAEATDLDRGAASRSIKLLSERGLVRTETGGGRISLVSLTKKGEALLQQLRIVGRRREDRLMAAFNPAERKQLMSLLPKLLSQVDFMNADDGAEAPPRSRAPRSKARK
jgi:DNA-binding MarR family transcriptional regulator